MSIKRTHLADFLEAIKIELTHEALEPRVTKVLGQDVLLQPPWILHFESCPVCHNRHGSTHERTCRIVLCVVMVVRRISYRRQFRSEIDTK